MRQILVWTCPHFVHTFANTFFNCSLKLFRERWNIDFCTENHYYTYFPIFLQKKLLLHHLVLKFYDFHQPHKKWRQNMFYYCSLSKYPSYSCQTVMNMNKNISRCNNIYRHTMPGSAHQSTKRLWQNSSQFSFWCGQVWTKCGQSVDKVWTNCPHQK